MGTGMSAFNLVTHTVVAFGAAGIRTFDSGTAAVIVMLVSLLGMLCALVLPSSWRTGSASEPDRH